MPSLSKSLGLSVFLMIVACGGKAADGSGMSTAGPNAGADAACGGYSVVHYPADDPCPARWEDARLKCGMPCMANVTCRYSEAGDGDQGGHCSEAVLFCNGADASADADAGGATFVCGQ